ncbi:MAG: hypothetical protein ACD_56C00008G0001, partial [uncultured bacterium]
MRSLEPFPLLNDIFAQTQFERRCTPVVERARSL